MVLHLSTEYHVGKEYFFYIMQPRIAKKCSIPVPMQVVVVIIGTGLSFGLGFDENYEVDVVGEIPQG